MDWNIHVLIDRFINLGNAEAGNGPKHPTAPNLKLAPSVEAILIEYPELRQDQGYVDFLESYAGAGLFWPNGDLIVDIFGVSDVSTNFLDLDVPFVDSQGYLRFCSEVIRIDSGFDTRTSTRGVQFAFDHTLQRQWGIYRGIDNEDSSKTDFQWYCKTFLEWLYLLIEHRGTLL